MSNILKVGITHGDVNGIGYEILLKTFSDNRILDFCQPVIYGSSRAASWHRKSISGHSVRFNFITRAEEAQKGKVNLVNCVKEEVRIEPGTPSTEAGKAAYMALNQATLDLEQGKIDLLITLPINKDTIQNEEFRFPGHTEFLEERFAKKGEKAMMILAVDNLRVALATTHLPLSEVSGRITKEGILEQLKALDQTLKRDFLIDRPRIAVLGLNPHAGENGLLGKEELEIITPAIKEAQEQWILCAGPFPSDGFFGSGRYKEFDAILAMYHDQGLIPFKTLAMDAGVNYTAGLPIIRTSPAHGTAYDIAGKDVASNKSFSQAIYMAIDIHRNRTFYDEGKQHPLKKMFFDRGRDDEKLDLTKDE